MARAGTNAAFPKACDVVTLGIDGLGGAEAEGGEGEEVGRAPRTPATLHRLDHDPIKLNRIMV
jgi:hypothetical protein